MVLEHGNLSRMLETAIVAARLAGQRAMEELDFIKFSVKNDDELVTQADKNCQQIIVDRIKETYPDHGFICEEGENNIPLKQSPRGSEQVWWVIDPIDGTNNFAHKMLLFSVSIAAMYQGRPIVGVIFEPATDSMFTAVKDGDPQLNSRRIQASQDPLDKFSIVGIETHFGDKVPQWAQHIILTTKYRNLGSVALHLAYLAKGSLHAVISTKPKLWDIAAGTIIAEAAGAVVTNQQGQEIFPLDMDSYQNQPLPIIAANKNSHDQFVKLLNNA